MAQEESLYLHSYSDTCVVAPKDGVEVKHYCSRTGMEYQVSDDLLKTIGHAPCKLLAIDMENHGRLEAFRSRIQEKYGDKISAIFSNPIYLEIFDKTAGKGNAVRFVCEHFQIPLSNSVAAGELPCLGVFGDDYDTPDGTGVRDYIHVVDLAKGHVLAIEKYNKPGLHICNLGTGQGYSVLELVHAFERVNGVKVKYEIKPRRAGDIATCYADPTRAKEELGWVATRGIDEMCRDTWNFAKTRMK